MIKKIKSNYTHILTVTLIKGCQFSLCLSIFFLQQLKKINYFVTPGVALIGKIECVLMIQWTNCRKLLNCTSTFNLMFYHVWSRFGLEIIKKACQNLQKTPHELYHIFLFGYCLIWHAN